MGFTYWRMDLSFHFCLRFVIASLLCLSGVGLLAGSSHGQERIFTVLMRDFSLAGTGPSPQSSALPNQVRDAVAGEIQSAGQAQFRVLTRREMQETAKTMGMRLPKDPLQPAEITSEDWLRLGRELKADAVIGGEVSIVNDRKKGTQVTVNFQVRDVYDSELLNGAQARQTVTPRSSESDEEALRRAAAEAAQDAVQQMLRRPQITTTVLAVRAGVVTLAGGRREGLKSGDELNVYHYGAGGRTALTGRIRVTKVEESQAEGKILTNSGIGPEDIARKTYRPTASGR